VRVWPPDGGEPVLVSQSNAAEMTRRRYPPWSLSPPEARRPQEAVEEQESSPYPTGGDYAAPTAAAERVPSELERLRDEATALNIDWESSWGKRRLLDEIAACQG
jgi:hypothetical protein